MRFGHKTPRFARRSLATPIRISPQNQAVGFAILRPTKLPAVFQAGLFCAGGECEIRTHVSLRDRRFSKPLP